MPGIGLRKGNRRQLVGEFIVTHNIQELISTRRRSMATAIAATAVTVMATRTVASASTFSATVVPKPRVGVAASHQHRLVYKLGTSLYVPITSRCNSATLPQTRGESFLLPNSVVDALCSVRDIEAQSSNQYYDESHESENAKTTIIKTKQKQKQGSPSCSLKRRLPPPPFPPVAELPKAATAQQEPTVDRLLLELQREFLYDEGPWPESIVISGEGEPMLRLDDTMELVRRIRSYLLAETPGSVPLPSIRLTTNGLFPTLGDPSVPQQLWDCGVSHISVGLMTWNAHQYDELMRPVLPLRDADDNDSDEAAFGLVCNFIQEAVRVGRHLQTFDKLLVVETTAVDRPDVDRDKTEALAKELGVTTPVRWRPFFP